MVPFGEEVSQKIETQIVQKAVSEKDILKERLRREWRDSL